MKIKFSVIIPTFNVEKYIIKTLDSIFLQMNNDVEVIIVDDNSTDNTVNVIEKYLKNINEKRFKLFKNKKNLGTSCTKNIGIKNAKGIYMIFVDGDDWISKNFFNILKRKTENNPDIIIIDTIKYIEKEKIFKVERFNFKKLDFNLSKKNQKKMIDNNICARHCRFIVKSSIIRKNRINFPAGLLHEDELWVIDIISKHKTILYVDSVKYFYRIHENSIMTTKTFNNTISILKIIILIYKRKEMNYKKYCRYVIFRCIKNIYGNYPFINESYKKKLDEWYSKNRKIFEYSIAYNNTIFILYKIYGYKKCYYFYKKLNNFFSNNKRKDFYTRKV